jgi:uncharacterized damage-inducible protein DinB
MATGRVDPVAVSRRIQAAAEDLFAVLADPSRHPGLDGSGMLRYAVAGAPVFGVGDAFVVRMHNDEMGEYEMTNYVVEFEPGRRIAWEPVLSAASRTEDLADIGTRAGHVWSFRLEADGPTTTVVTEIFDCTRSPDWLKKAVKGGTRWTESMTATLARLDEQCATRMTRDDVGGEGVRPTASAEKAVASSATDASAITLVEDPDASARTEREALLATLQSQRNHVLGILEGLDDDALHRSLLPSGWTFTGLVNHLALDVERFWFRAVIAAEPAAIEETVSDSADAWNICMTLPGTTVMDTYRRETEHADAVLATTTLDHPPKWWPANLFGSWRLHTVREVMLHVISETATHAGHLDAARELLDGRRWLVLSR